MLFHFEKIAALERDIMLLSFAVLSLLITILVGKSPKISKTDYSWLFFLDFWSPLIIMFEGSF
jgi:hypothetical protein